jgi:LPXTG-motif cell wall-anchored protein
MSGTIDGNASPYEAMAEAVKASVEQLLIPFHVASDPQGPLRDMATEAFFQKFLVYADKFTGQCCQDFSRILRQASVVPEVRGTPTLLLAKQAAAAEVAEQEKKSEQADKAANKGCGGCLVAVGIVILIAAVAMIMDTTSTNPGESMAFAFVLGISLLGAGAFYLTKKKPPGTGGTQQK